MDSRERVTSAIARVDPFIDLSTIKDDLNLVETGLIDSVKFLEIVSVLEEDYGMEIDFLTVDVAQMTSINGLVEVFSSVPRQ